MAWDKGGIRMDTNNDIGVVENNDQQNQNTEADVQKSRLFLCQKKKYSESTVKRNILIE